MSLLVPGRAPALAPAGPTTPAAGPRHRRTATAVLAGGLLGGLLLAGLLPLDPLTQDLPARFSPPSPAHPLGTDSLGRDVLARLLAGARLSIGLTALLVVVSAAAGTLLGLVAAVAGGWCGQLVERLVDTVVAVPGIVLGLVLAAALGPGLLSVTLAVLLVAWTPYARLARALAGEVLRSAHVELAVATGAGRRRVLVRHVAPAVLRPLVAHACLRFVDVLLTIGGLSFLGVGVQPPTAEWGSMVADGQLHAARAPWLLLAPAAALVATSLAAGALGRALEQRWAVRR